MEGEGGGGNKSGKGGWVGRRAQRGWVGGQWVPARVTPSIKRVAVKELHPGTVLAYSLLHVTVISGTLKMYV